MVEVVVEVVVVFSKVVVVVMVVVVDVVIIRSDLHECATKQNLKNRIHSTLIVSQFNCLYFAIGTIK